MISGRDRRVLDDIERDLRATDPGLCERLSRVEPPPGPGRRAFERLVGTPAILAWLAALGTAVLLGLPGPAMALFVVVIACLSVRVSRIETHLPGAPPFPPPFGLPPTGPR